MSTTARPTPGGGPESIDLSENPYLVVERSAKFRDLRSRFRRFVFPMGVFFLGYYFLLMYMAGWHREWMATPVWGSINIGTVFALTQFVTTFLIAWLYTRYADRNIDPERYELKAEVEQLQARQAAAQTTAEV